jgi:hypothetical protein
MNSKVLLICAMVLAAGAAMAQEAAAPPVENTTVTGTKPEPLLCIRSDPPTGSHMGAKKICHTRVEWQQTHLSTAQGLRNMEDDEQVKAQQALAAEGGR